MTPCARKEYKKWPALTVDSVEPNEANKSIRQKVTLVRIRPGYKIDLFSTDLAKFFDCTFSLAFQGGKKFDCLHLDAGVVIRADKHELLRRIFIDLAMSYLTKPRKDLTRDRKKNEGRFIELLLICLFPATTSNVEVISDPSGKGSRRNEFVTLR